MQYCHVYSEQCMSIQKVCKWEKKCEDGRTAVDDMPRSGRPNDSISSFDNIQQIRDLLEDDRRMTIIEILLCLQSPDCSRASVGRIIHKLKMCKVSSRWVSRLLTAQRKKKRIDSALNFLLRYE